MDRLIEAWTKDAHHAELRSLLEKAERGEQVVIQKNTPRPEAKAVDGVEGGLEFVISDADPDRDADTIDIFGWELENYRANPVVLFAHDNRSPAIGKSLRVTVKGKQLVSVDQLAIKEFEFAALIHRLVTGGYMKATSVGFRPLEWVFNERRQGYDFKRQELFEHSIVPVPANPRALERAAADGVDLAPMRKYAEQILDSAAGPGVWVPKWAMEQMHTLTNNGRQFVLPLVVTSTGNTKIESEGGSKSMGDHDKQPDAAPGAREATETALAESEAKDTAPVEDGGAGNSADDAETAAPELATQEDLQKAVKEVAELVLEELKSFVQSAMKDMVAAEVQAALEKEAGLAADGSDLDDEKGLSRAEVAAMLREYRDADAADRKAIEDEFNQKVLGQMPR